MVGEDFFLAAELLDGVPEAFQLGGVFDVGRGFAHLRGDLGEDGAAEAVFAESEIDQEELGVAGVGDELGREREADVGDGGEGGDDERGGRGHALGLVGLGVFPGGAHAHRVFADRDGDAEGGTEFHADRADGGVEVGTVARDGGSGHPVGGEVDLAEVADLGGSEVCEGFADGEAGGGSGGVDGDGRAFAHRHGFAGVDVEGGSGDGAIGHGNLPRADHLIAGDQAGDGAVADGDEEGFVGDGRVGEDAVNGVGEGEAVELERVLRTFERRGGAVHARRFAEEHIEGEIDGGVVEMGVGEDEFFFLGGGADDGEGAAFAVADGLERLDAGGRHGHDVALLGFVAPDFERGHAGLVVGELAELELAAASAVVDEFGQGVGNAAGADVVDEGNGIFITEGPAAVDDFLTTAFHLGVLALDGGEIEVFVAVAAGH